jgi:hypothetical protein
MEPAADTQIIQEDPDMKRLEALSKLLDNQFVIPGTSLRFGLDGIVGLIPYVGDMAGLLVSGVLLRTMFRKGAGPFVMLRMAGNYVLDALVGVVPLVGDLFDFGFKANRRNVEMLKRYYSSGKPRPSAKWSVALFGVLFFVGFILMIWGVWKLAAYLVASLS